MKRPVKNVLLFFAAVATFVLLLELSLALFSPHKLRVRPYHEQYDPVLGWVNKPLKDDGIQFELDHNRFFQVRHNSLGLRGRETTYDKPRGVSRVLFVGNSSFWGYGVSNDEMFTEVLQKALPPEVEVLNGGVTGYGIDQEYLWLKQEGLRYRPDIVFFGFSAGNALQEIARSVNYNTPKPVFMIEEGKLVLKNVPVPRSAETDRKTFGAPRTAFGKLKRFLRYHTHTYQFITRRLNADPERRLFLINIGLADEYTASLGNIPVLTNPPEKLQEIAFRLVRESRRTAEAAGARFVLVFIPEKEEDRSGRLTVHGAQPGEYERNSSMNALIHDFARREKIAVLDLLAFSREQYRSGVSIYNDSADRHWTPAGHQLVANEFLRYLRKDGDLAL